MNENNAWAEALAAGSRWVLHTPSSVVGRVAKYYPEGTYVGPGDTGAVQAPVVKLHNGHAFCAAAISFVELDEKAAGFYQAMQAALANTLRECMMLAASIGVDPTLGRVLVEASLSDAKRRVAAPEQPIQPRHNRTRS